MYSKKEVLGGPQFGHVILGELGSYHIIFHSLQVVGEL